jgi:hypothetical protein
MDNQQATDFELGWLAGIVDGEGWLGMSLSQEHRPTRLAGQSRPIIVKVELKITNCDEAVIDKASAILVKLGFNPYRRSHKQLGENRRIVHECALKNMTTLVRLLPILQPHLTGIKQERSKLILRFIELRQNNPGIVRPGFDERKGKRGRRTTRPYTAEELAVVEMCRELQSRGASETTRENRERAYRTLTSENAQLVSNGNWSTSR